MLPLLVLLLIINCSTTVAGKNLGLQDAKKIKSDARDIMGGKGYAIKQPSDFVLESLSVLRSHATSTNIFLQEIRSTFNSFEERLAKMNDRLDRLEGTMKVSLEKTDVIRKHVNLNKEMITKVDAGIVANREVSATIKARQNVMLSEVRLISLYKMTDQSSTSKSSGAGYGGHASDLAVDGQFVFSEWNPKTPVRTMAHTEKLPNQKISIDLGGLFRIHRVKIWHARHCCMERSVGLRIIADSRLLGVTSSSAWIHDFKVAEDDPIYAKSVTVHRLETNYLNFNEIQVWGTGPFAENDKFA